MHSCRCTSLAGQGTTHRPESWRLPLRRPCTLMGEGRPPRRPHIRRPWEGRPPRRPHFHVASGFTPRLCPWVRDPSWRKASRYVLGRDDLRVVRTATAHRHPIVASSLAEAFHFNRGGTTSAPYSTNAISSSGRPSTKSPHR